MNCQTIETKLPEMNFASRGDGLEYPIYIGTGGKVLAYKTDIEIKKNTVVGWNMVKMNYYLNSLSFDTVLSISTSLALDRHPEKTVYLCK